MRSAFFSLRKQSVHPVRAVLDAAHAHVGEALEDAVNDQRRDRVVDRAVGLRHAPERPAAERLQVFGLAPVRRVLAIAALARVEGDA